MTGIIVTGHGSFATGITSGIRLLAGDPQDYAAVDFLPEDSVDSLTGKLEAAVKKLENCDGIVIYADLTGGSPFNAAIRMKMEHPEKLEVIGGANLPAVMDCYMSRMVIESAAVLAENSLYAGRQAMVYFTPAADDEDDYEE